MTRWFSDASVLTRYGIATVNYGTSSGLPDAELGENLEIEGLVKMAEVYALAAARSAGWRNEARHVRATAAGRPACSTATRSPCSTSPTCASTSSAAARTRPASASRSTGARLRAPIVPKKFFHTAGNFREHEEESKQVGWSHQIAPWIVFFQNVDAIVGPDEPVVYPEHLTEELDYELELAVVIRKPGK